jgi:hypothetical protein
MLKVSGLWSHGEALAHQDAILDQLRQGSMPCDGTWSRGPGSPVQLLDLRRVTALIGLASGRRGRDHEPRHDVALRWARRTSGCRGQSPVALVAGAEDICP